mgnify:CR=1 FL=1|jgi:hypothetical protein
MKLIIENWRKYKTQIDQVDEMATRADKEGVDLPDLLDTLQHYTVEDTATPTHYITYTSLNKVGINPGSKYNTPNGIYTYPLTKSIFQLIEIGDLPYAQDKEYISVIMPKEETHMLTRSTPINMTTFLKKIYSREALDAGLIHNEEIIREIKDHYLQELDIDENLISFQKIKADSRHQSNFGILWNLTRIAAGEKPNTWSALMRWIGFDGAYDNGDGIIHPMEPTQGVFFSKSALTVVETFPNKYTPEIIRTREKQWLRAGTNKLAYTILRDKQLFGPYRNHEIFKDIRNTFIREFIIHLYGDIKLLTPENLGAVYTTKFNWGLSTMDASRSNQDVKDLLYTLTSAPESEQYREFWYDSEILRRTFASFCAIIRQWMRAWIPWVGSGSYVIDNNPEATALFNAVDEFTPWMADGLDHWQKDVKKVLDISVEFKNKFNIPNMSLDKKAWEVDSAALQGPS